MEYRIEISERAHDELERAYQWIAKDAPVRAVDWFNELVDLIDSLHAMPERCPLAPENGLQGLTIRNALHPPYRIIFTIRSHTVQILHIRHSAMQQLDRM